MAALSIRVPADIYRLALQTSDEVGVGWRWSWRGLRWTLARDLVFASIQYPLYQHMSSPLNGLHPVLSGAIAGGFAAFLTAPLDALRVSRQASTLVGMRVSLWRASGFLALWRGAGLRAVTFALGGSIYFSIYEAVQRRLGLLSSERI